MIKQENSRAKIDVRNLDFFGMVLPLLTQGKVVRIRIKGMSMHPLLQDARDLVDIKHADNIKRGDLVLAQVSPDAYVLHRVIRKQGEQLTLMGDGNINAIEHCLCSDVIGKVILIIRNGRNIEPMSYLFRIYSSLWMWLNPLKKHLLPIYKIIIKRDRFTT